MTDNEISQKTSGQRVSTAFTHNLGNQRFNLSKSVVEKNSRFGTLLGIALSTNNFLDLEPINCMVGIFW